MSNSQANNQRDDMMMGCMMSAINRVRDVCNENEDLKQEIIELRKEIEKNKKKIDELYEESLNRNTEFLQYLLNKKPQGDKWLVDLIRNSRLVEVSKSAAESPDDEEE